jgi:methyl coenzyme M reductase alpha subunit
VKVVLPVSLKSKNIFNALKAKMEEDSSVSNLPSKFEQKYISSQLSQSPKKKEEAERNQSLARL